MNLEAIHHTRQHTIFFPCRFPGLRGGGFYFLTLSEFSGRFFILLGMFLVCFSWAGLGMVFAYFVLPTPCSAPGLVWVIGPLIVAQDTFAELRLGGFRHIPRYVFFRSIDPSPLEDWRRYE